MFLNQEDYIGVCDENTLDIIQQSDEPVRQCYERNAMEEVASYLRSRYDMQKAFVATGDDRNPMLVLVTVNIALYYLVHALPQNMGLDARKELYDDAIAWLKMVQAGKATPNLPTYESSDGTDPDTSNPMRYGSMEKSKYDW